MSTKISDKPPFQSNSDSQSALRSKFDHDYLFPAPLQAVPQGWEVCTQQDALRGCNENIDGKEQR